MTIDITPQSIIYTDQSATKFQVTGSLVSGSDFVASHGLTKSANYVIYTGSTLYYAENGFSGKVEFSGSDAMVVINSAIQACPHNVVSLPFGSNPTISAPCGKIWLTSGRFSGSQKIVIPLGSRLTIEGAGTTLQPANTGVLGGTQIVSSDPTGIMIANDSGSTSAGLSTNVSGTELILKNIEFVQNVPLTDVAKKAMLLNGAAQGILDNVVITTYKSFENRMNGYGLSIDNWQYGGSWVWNRLQVYGFKNAIQDYTNHLNANSVDIGAADQALVIWTNPNHVYRNLHVFAVQNVITVAGGDPNLLIEGMYVEDFRDSANLYYAWWADPTYFRGKVIVKRLASNVSESNKIWSFYNSGHFQFEHVTTSPTSYALPEPDTPVLVSTTIYTNTYSGLVQVHIEGGTVTSLKVRGISTGATSGDFLLYPNDTIQVTYTGGTTWFWLSLADHVHQTVGV